MRNPLAQIIIAVAIVLVILLGSFSQAKAAPVSWDFAAGVLQPLQSGWSALVKANRYQATSTTAASIFPYASTTAVSVSGLASGECVQAGTGGLLTTTGSACGSGGGGGVSSVTGTYPVISSGGATPAISLAFGTTTSNTWAGTQTFTNTISVAALSGLVGANNGILYSFASSSLFGYVPVAPTRQITVAGTANQVTSSAGAQDLSADRTWTLSLPSHVIFPSSFQVASATTTNATSTLSQYFSFITGSTQCLQVDTTGKVSGTGSACGAGGGGGSPGGTATELQYRAGAATFGAITSVYDAVKTALGIGTTTLTTNPAVLTLATSTNTGALLNFSGGAGNPGWSWFNQSGDLFLATTSDTTGATTTLSSNMALGKYGAMFGLGATTPISTDVYTLFIRDQNGTGPRLSLGGNPGGDTNWNFFRVANNDAVSNDNLYIGTGDDGTTPAQNFTFSSGGFFGVGSSTPWGKSSIELDTTSPAFVVANQGSTTPSLLVTGVNQNGAVAIGSSSPSQNHNFVVAGTSLLNGTTTIESRGNQALTVGPNGASNPTLTIIGSILNQATGISIQGAATAGSTAIVATDSGANSSLTINAKGSGTIGIGTVSTGTVTVGSGGNVNVTSSAAGTVAIQTGGTTYLSQTRLLTNFSYSTVGAQNHFTYTGPVESGLAASTEATSVTFNMSQLRTHTAGTITLQRDFRVLGSTHAFAGASALTDYAVFTSEFSTAAATNATIANSHAIYVPTAALGAGRTNSYGLTVQAATGATNNFAGVFTGGNVGIGTTSPMSLLAVAGTITANNINATSTTATSVFSGIVQVVTRFVGVISAAFTPTTEGEIGIDTTSNQFKFFSNGATRVLGNGNTYPSFTYSTTTAWTGTTTVPLAPAFVGETWNGVQCFTDVGTLNVSFTDGTNAMNLFNASTTVGTVGLVTNNTFTAAEKRYVDIGTPATAPTKISCTVSKSITAD